ncbi:MAG: CotH kinase family protein [Deltaproteobacteria bacterium]|nr:CotH kinase family protein [Deltaproteobacteria bacterium]
MSFGRLPRLGLVLGATLLAACAAPEAPSFVPDPVERIPGSFPPPAVQPVYSPCDLPSELDGVQVPPVDLDDPESVFALGGLPLVDIRFPVGAWEQACVDAKFVADWMDARRRGQDVQPIDRPTVTVDAFIQGEAFYDVGFRFRGQSNLYAMFYDRWNRPVSGSLEACQTDRMPKKASYRVIFDAFGTDRTVAGQRAFNLGGREGSDSPYLREVAAQHVAREFGLPAPLAGHARVCRDGIYDGLFTLGEEADYRALVERVFPGESDGGYWEVVGPSSQTWERDWTDTTGWQTVYDGVRPTSDDDIGRLALLLDAGTAVEAGEDPQGLDELLDVDTWLRNIALDMVIPDYDGMMGNHKNHTLYDHPTRGLLPIGYDKDLAFVDLGNYLYGLCSGSIWGANPCWSSRRSAPAVARHLLDTRPDEYVARIEELLAGPLDPQTLIPWIEAQAEVIRPWVVAGRYYQPGGPACDLDPANCQYYTPAAWDYDVFLIGANIEERRAEVTRQLEGTFVCEDSCIDPPYIWLADRIY